MLVKYIVFIVLFVSFKTLIDAISTEVIENYDVVSPVITHSEGSGVRCSRHRETLSYS